MRNASRSLLWAALLLAALWPLSAHATWPTTIRENLPISNDPSPYVETTPFAFPYPDGKTLVVFYENYFGASYQIVDRYGQLQFPEPQLLLPALQTGYIYDLTCISDGQGGVIASWGYSPYNPIMPIGLYAQRIDSLGNICWGDSAIWIIPQAYTHWWIGSDGQGGFFLAYEPSNGPGASNLYAQHFDMLGQQTWADSGVVVCDAQGSQDDAAIAPDGQGGAYIAWQDQRPPYTMSVATFMQRLNARGEPLWADNGVFLANGTWFLEVLPDGQGGMLVHTDAGASVSWANNVYRVAPNGQVLWICRNVSRTAGAQLIAGDPGYFYLGYRYGSRIYGQKIDLQGHAYWPNWTTGQMGALIGDYRQWAPFHLGLDFAYRDSLFYAMFNTGTDEMPFINNLWLQALNPDGRRHWHGNGILFAICDWWPQLYTKVLNVVPDDSQGMVCVWEYGYEGSLDNDIWAKRINSDGSLGGPQPPIHIATSDNLRRTLSVSQNIIRYELLSSSQIKLSLYNLLGQRVALLEEGQRLAGAYAVPLNLDHLPSGIYLLQLTTPSGAQTAKVAVVR